MRELSIIYWAQQLNCYFKVKVWKKLHYSIRKNKSVLIYFEFCRSESSNVVHIHLSKRSLILKKFFRMKTFTFLVEMCFGHSYRIAVYKFLKLANNIFFVFTPIKSSLHLRPLIQISHGLAVHTCARCRAKFFLFCAHEICVCVCLTWCLHYMDEKHKLMWRKVWIRCGETDLVLGGEFGSLHLNIFWWSSPLIYHCPYVCLSSLRH